MAVNLAARSEHFVLTDGVVSLIALVTDLRDSDQDVAYAYVTDRKEQVLAHSFAGGFPEDLIGVNTPEPNAPWRTEVLDTVQAGIVHDISVPILKGKAGAVHVGISEQRIERTISHFTAAIVVIAAVVLLVGAGLAALVSWVVTQPVRGLTEAAQKIRDGDLGQQVAASTKDEIGELVEAFNQMSAELLKQHNVLEDRSRRIKIAREQAAWQRDKLRAIIDSMVEGVIFVDAEGTISLCNESAERIWGRSAQELVGRHLLECHTPSARPRIMEIVKLAKDMPGVAVAHSTRLRKRLRKGRCVSNYSSVHSEDGRYLGLVLLAQDISEKVHLEQEQKRLREQLFQQEKMVLVGQIAASVAHELNTPLSTILLRTQLVRRELEDGQCPPDVDVIETEAKRCRRIIDSLLGFSRRSEGAMSRTDVDALVQQSVALVENDLTLKGISAEVRFADGGAAIWADSNQIQQVLLNLITNAADAMADGGRLAILTRSADGTVEIRVADDGCGMGPDVLDRAFEPFFTTKEEGKGTGLGLAICQRVVEEHEGQIEIHSESGHGTTVVVRLPCAAAEGAAGE
jgi:PAS domain S-box-containing protein